MPDDIMVGELAMYVVVVGTGCWRCPCLVRAVVNDITLDWFLRGIMGEMGLDPIRVRSAGWPARHPANERFIFVFVFVAWQAGMLLLNCSTVGLGSRRRELLLELLEIILGFLPA